MLNDQPTLVGVARLRPSPVCCCVSHAATSAALAVRAEGEIANLILQAFIWRRIGLASPGQSRRLTLIGQEGEAEHLKLQRFPSAQRLSPSCDFRESLPKRLSDVVTTIRTLGPLWSSTMAGLLHHPTVSKLQPERTRHLRKCRIKHHL